MPTENWTRIDTYEALLPFAGQFLAYKAPLDLNSHPLTGGEDIAGKDFRFWTLPGKPDVMFGLLSLEKPKWMGGEHQGFLFSCLLESTHFVVVGHITPGDLESRHGIPFDIRQPTETEVDAINTARQTLKARLSAIDYPDRPIPLIYPRRPNGYKLPLG